MAMLIFRRSISVSYLTCGAVGVSHGKLEIRSNTQAIPWFGCWTNSFYFSQFAIDQQTWCLLYLASMDFRIWSSNSSNQWFGGIRVWGLVKNFRVPTDTSGRPLPESTNLEALCSGFGVDECFRRGFGEEEEWGGKSPSGAARKTGSRVCIQGSACWLGVGSRDMGRQDDTSLVSKISWLGYLFGFCVD